MAHQTAVYLRISDDKNGEQTSTSRQREDCLKLATAQGWTVHQVYEDLDLSAYKRRVVRPAFEAMLDDIRAGAVTAVVGWKLDRIARQHRDLSRLFDALEDVGGFVVTIVDAIDTRSQPGRMYAEIATTFARGESENISSRVKSRLNQRAAEGKPQGGARPFGYTLARTALVPEEAELVREASRRYLAGESLRGIRADWTRRGVRTTQGNQFTGRTLGRMLRTWGLAGQREHQGAPLAGTWTPILTIAEVERIRAVMDHPSRNTGLGAPRRYLLTGGIARCGKCGEALTSRPSGKGVRRYVCAKDAGRPGCGGIARQAEPVETLVAEMLFEALAGVDVSQFLESDSDDEHDRIAAEVRADDEALVELADDYYTQRAIGRPEFFTQREKLTARLEANRQRLARSARTNPLAGMVDIGKEVAARWPHETLEWKRAVVSAVIDSVTIGPAKRGLAKFDPSAITVRWKF